MTKIGILNLCFGTFMFGLMIVLHKLDFPYWFGWLWIITALLNAIVIIVDNRLNWWSSKHINK